MPGSALPDSSAAPPDSEGAQQFAVKRARLEQRFTIALLFAIAAVTVLAYSAVLFDFFVGDDYVHLTWLKQAVVDPQLVWKNFYSSWLDGVTTKFYRPLISVFMVTDYLVWKTNGLGFHLTNLAFHLIATVGLFGVVAELRKATDKDPSKQHAAPPGIDWWALAAAALFALYPLHPEAVSWITGRVDAIVTAFSIVSLWCYMRWRNGSHRTFAIASGMTMVLALLSKEMAVTLPAIFVCFEVVRLFATGSEARGNLKTAAVNVASALAPFWLIVGAYFLLRRVALGTFVGGYDDSLFFIADLKNFVYGWAHALRMVLIPINGELLTSHSFMTRAWQFLVLGTAALSLWTAVSTKAARLQFVFLCAWFALSLVPVYKIFAIADDLQGSRLAYMATAPLCAVLMLMLTSGITTLPGTTAGAPARMLTRLKALLATVFIVLAGVVLFINNVPWTLAGIESNRIRAGLDELYTDKIEGDPEVLLVGLPDTTTGAYTCRNALQGMTQTPQFSRDVQHILQINPFEPILPFGFLKESMAANKNAMHVFRWNTESGKFESEPIGGVQLRSDIELTVSDKPPTAQRGMRGKLYDVQVPSLPCWSVEFVRVVLSTPKAEPIAADLFYANTADSQFQLKRRSHAEDPQSTQQHTLLFPLRGLPDWALGGRSVKFRLGVPLKSDARIESIKVIPRDRIMPTISFSNSGYHGTKGYLHLGKDASEQTITVNYAGMSTATSAVAEIARANLLFEEQNCTAESKVQGMMLPFSPTAPGKGTLTLRRDQFKIPGIYELRAWAKDAAGSRAGVCSDHIVIAVAPE